MGIVPDQVLPSILAALLAVSSWAEPQPAHSAGLLGLYGNDALVRANADWRGYSLVGYAFGLSAISPAMLGRVAWVRVPGGRWIGPGLVVDSVARKDAYASIYQRREIAEVSRAVAERLGFEFGAQGEICFCVCPPGTDSVAEPYAPALAWDTGEPDHTPSFFPYPIQQAPVADCGRRE